MKITLSKALIAVNMLTLLLVLLVHESSSQIARIIVGIPFLLFFPGFALMAAIAPSRTRPDTTERLVLSFALSIAIVPFIGLALNYTSLGIKLDSVLYSVSLFVFLSSAIAWLRQLSLAGGEKAVLEFHLQMSGRAGGTLDKALAIIMVAVITATLVTAAGYFTAPKKTEAFTQFYFVEQAGRYYPNELNQGEGGTVTLGITNHEGDQVNYRVQILLNGEKYTEIGPVAISDGQKWQTDTVIVPETAGPNQEIEFLLFKDHDPSPYLKPLYLWVDVRDNKAGAGK